MREKDKYSSINEDEYNIDEEKFKGGNLGFLRQETELFDDGSYIVHELINARRIELSRGGEDWEILKDKKPVLTLKGVRFTKKERAYLRSVEGMLFIVNGYKLGWKSVSEFKRQLKKKKNDLRKKH